MGGSAFVSSIAFDHKVSVSWNSPKGPEQERQLPAAFHPQQPGVNAHAAMGIS